jgi:hypothetical protein
MTSTNRNHRSARAQARSIRLALLIVVLLAGVSAAQAQWTTNSNDVYKTNTAGNVGIGTTNPQSKLEIDSGDLVLTHVSGDTGKKGIFAYNTPYSAEHAFSFTRQNTVANSDLSISAYAGIGLTGGKTAPESSAFHFYINPSGNVGIGTTSPGGKLDISGGTYSLPATSGTSQTGLVARFKDSRTSGDVVLDVGNAANANAAWLQSTDMRNLAINYSLLLNPNGGNVGIGTTSPSQPLDIQAATAIMYLHSSTGANRTFLVAANGGGNAYVGVENSAGNGVFNGDLPYASVFGTVNANAVQLATNNTSRVTIDSSGNVGIGTASPYVKLQVASGDISIDADHAIRKAGDNSIIAYSSSLPGIVIGSGATTDQVIINAGGYERARILTNGNVGIGRNDPSYKLDVSGDTRVTGNINLTGTVNAKYQDIAEWVPSSEKVSAGTVVVLDSTKSNQVTASTTSYDTRVAGVVSEQPGIALGEKSDNKVLVATSGRVRVKVDASNGAIHIGDLLVTSNIPGVAMKSEPLEFGGRKMHMPGTLIGKALEPLEKGKGEILVLLSLQ